jgi:hypothetical protein
VATFAKDVHAFVVDATTFNHIAQKLRRACATQLALLTTFFEGQGVVHRSLEDRGTKRRLAH